MGVGRKREEEGEWGEKGSGGEKGSIKSVGKVRKRKEWVRMGGEFFSHPTF